MTRNPLILALLIAPIALAPTALAPVALAQTAAPPAAAPKPPAAVGAPLPLTAVPTAKPSQPLPQVTTGIVPGKLAPTQKEVLVSVSQYFQTIRTMNGEFVQFGPNGRTDGEFYLSKPGKIRFHYAKPSNMEIIADGTDVIIKDRKNQTQDLYPLSKTPLKFLLSDKIDLSTEPSVTKVAVDADLVTVTLEQNTVFGDGKLDMVFDRKTSALAQWTVTDAQGYDTTVAIYNTTINPEVDQKQFYIERIPLLNSGGRLR